MMWRETVLKRNRMQARRAASPKKKDCEVPREERSEKEKIRKLGIGQGKGVSPKAQACLGGAARKKTERGGLG